MLVQDKRATTFDENGDYSTPVYGAIHCGDCGDGSRRHKVLRPSMTPE